jgi:hypothetical protein
MSPQPGPTYGERQLLWGILGGVGCLGGLMLVACAGLLLLSLRGGRAAASERPTMMAVVASASSTPTPTAEPVSGVLVYDDFSQPERSAFTAAEDATSRSAFDDGAYVIVVKAADTLAWALTDRRYGDLAVEVDSVIAPGPEMVAAGLIFHYQDPQNFYLFSISSDGYYALEMLKGDDWQTLIDWTESDAIDATHNSLRVETRGDRITLKVNGALLEATQDDSLSGGDAGLAVSSFDASPVTIRYDNLLITRSP